MLHGKMIYFTGAATIMQLLLWESKTFIFFPLLLKVERGGVVRQDKTKQELEERR
jgi:hypothetical protein